jgi:hypothetical protein
LGPGVELVKLFWSKFTPTFWKARPFNLHTQYLLHCYEKI